MFEAWECLVGETHDEKANPSEDLGMPVGIDVKDRDGCEASLHPDGDEQKRSPDGACRERNGNAGFKEATVDRVRRVNRRLDRDLTRPVNQVLQLPQEGAQFNTVGPCEEPKRLGRTFGSATSLQPITIKDRTSIWKLPQQVADGVTRSYLHGLALLRLCLFISFCTGQQFSQRIDVG